MLPGMCSNFHSPMGCVHVAETMDLGSHYRILADGRQENMECVPLVSSNIREKTVSSVGQADFGRVFRMLWKHIIRNVFLLRLLVWQELLEMMQSQNRQMRNEVRDSDYLYSLCGLSWR